MLDYHGVNGGGGAGRCWVAFEPHLLIIGPWSLNNNRKTRGLIWFISLCPPSRALGRRIYCFDVFFVKRESTMADNLLDMGPSAAKRPKLNSPALSSDTPGKMLTCHIITPVKYEAYQKAGSDLDKPIRYSSCRPGHLSQNAFTQTSNGAGKPFTCSVRNSQVHVPISPVPSETFQISTR